MALILLWAPGCGHGGGSNEDGAVTFDVTSTRDDADAVPGDGACATIAGECTVRAAIEEANALPGPTVVQLSAATYVLSRGPLMITHDVTLRGTTAPESVVDGGGRDSLLDVRSGNVMLERVTIRNGHASNAGGGITNRGALTLVDCRVAGNRADNAGAGIETSGTLTVIRSVISDNIAGNAGGGIANSGTVELLDSTVQDNRADNGGAGIVSDTGALLRLSSCTVSGNSAGNAGAGIDNAGTAVLVNTTLSGNTAQNAGGGIDNSGMLTLSNATLTANTAGGAGGGIASSGQTVAMNTIIAANSGNAPDCIGTLTSQGFNLIADTAECVIAGDLTGNLTGVDPRLGPLAENGGTTFSHALLPDSPAIDGGNPATPGQAATACERTDQRGVARPQRQRCDIGAYELE